MFNEDDEVMDAPLNGMSMYRATVQMLSPEGRIWVREHNEYKVAVQDHLEHCGLMYIAHDIRHRRKEVKVVDVFTGVAQWVRWVAGNEIGNHVFNAEQAPLQKALQQLTLAYNIRFRMPYNIANLLNELGVRNGRPVKTTDEMCVLIRNYQQHVTDEMLAEAKSRYPWAF